MSSVKSRISSSVARNSHPLTERKTIAVASAIRLLPSTNGWSSAIDRSRTSGFVENRRVRGLAESGLSGQFEDPLQNVRAATTADHLKRRHSVELTGHTFGQLER